MAKLTLNNIISGFTALFNINANNELIEDAIENTLSRDGTGPNTMQADIDMNGHRVVNVGSPLGSNDLVTVEYLTDELSKQSSNVVGNINATTTDVSIHSLTVGRGGGSSAPSTNTALGFHANNALTTSAGNTALGYNTLANNVVGSNTAVGYSAGAATTTGSNNIFVGVNAGNTNTSGAFNTYIGPNSGTNSLGNYNTIIGAYNGAALASNLGPTSTGVSNNVVLSDGAGTVRMWCDSDGNWHLPLNKLLAVNAGSVNALLYVDGSGFLKSISGMGFDGTTLTIGALSAFTGAVTTNAITSTDVTCNTITATSGIVNGGYTVKDLVVNGTTIPANGMYNPYSGCTGIASSSALSILWDPLGNEISTRGLKVIYAPAPTSLSGTNTITTTDLMKGHLEITATSTITLPTGSAIDTAMGAPFNTFTNVAFDYHVTSTGGFNVTITGATGTTLNSTISAVASPITLRFRRTGTGTYTVYRVR